MCARGSEPGAGATRASSAAGWDTCPHRAGLGGRRGRAAFGSRTGRAPDQRLQVDFLHHAAGHQKFVGRLVGVVQLHGHDRCQRVLHQRPGIAGHLGLQPLVHQDAGGHVGEQHVTARQLLALLQMLHTQAQLVEFGGRLFEHAHGQARRHDLVVDGALGHQFKRTRQADGLTGAGGAWQQSALQRLAALVEPGGLVFLESGPGVAPGLHVARRAGLVEDGGQAGVAGLDHFGKGTTHVNHEEFTRLFGQGGDVLIGRRHNEISMTRKDSASRCWMHLAGYAPRSLRA